MSYCPRCGRKLPSEDLTYCPHCGSPLTLIEGHPEKKKDRRKAIAAILGVSSLLGLGFIAYRLYGDEISELISKILTSREKTETIMTTTKSTEVFETTTTPSTHVTSTESVITTPRTSPSPTISPSSTITTSDTTTRLTTSETTFIETTTSTTTSPIVIPDIPERDWEHMVFPYIVAGGQAYYEQVETVVINQGNTPSFFTVLELYHGPHTTIPGITYNEYPLNSFRLVWRGTTSLNPGERIDFDFSELSPRYEVLIWVCYDPILDPKSFVMNSDAPVRSIYRRSDDRDRHVIVVGRGGLVED